MNKNRFAFSPGWNFFNVNITDWQQTSGVNLSDINFLMIRMDSVDKTIETSLYFDSIVLDYKMKPTVLLNFDNSDEDLYNVTYPLLKERGFVGTAFISLQDGWGNGTDGKLTEEHYKEMDQNGWSFGMYGVRDLDGYISNEELSLDNNYEEQLKAINAHKAYLESIGLKNVIAYACPKAQISMTNLKALKDAGFKMIRAIGGDITYAYNQLTSFNSNGIYNGDTFESIKTKIDSCIKTGTCISIFTHKIQTDDSGINCNEELYVEMLDYLKQKVDAGELQVMSYNEFYEACTME